MGPKTGKIVGAGGSRNPKIGRIYRKVNSLTLMLGKGVPGSREHFYSVHQVMDSMRWRCTATNDV